MKLEAGFVLGTLVSGTAAQSQTVLDEGAIPWFVKLLHSTNDELRGQVWICEK